MTGLRLDQQPARLNFRKMDCRKHVQAGSSCRTASEHDPYAKAWTKDHTAHSAVAPFSFEDCVEESAHRRKSPSRRSEAILRVRRASRLRPEKSAKRTMRGDGRLTGCTGGNTRTVTVDPSRNTARVKDAGTGQISRQLLAQQIQERALADTYVFCLPERAKEDVDRLLPISAWRLLSFDLSLILFLPPASAKLALYTVENCAIARASSTPIVSPPCPSTSTTTNWLPGHAL